MNIFYRSGLFILGIVLSTSAFGQQQPPPNSYIVVSGNSSVKVTIAQLPDSQPVPTNTRPAPDTVVLSGTATTARIADPNEPILFSGRVMRMADFVAAFSSNNAAAQHPRTPEMHNREIVQPVPPSPQSD
jgi:hypothetical protein